MNKAWIYINKKDWIVRIECLVIKDVYVKKCTEEEARTNPFAHATDEVEIDQRNWEVKSVISADESY